MNEMKFDLGDRVYAQNNGSKQLGTVVDHDEHEYPKILWDDFPRINIYYSGLKLYRPCGYEDFEERMRERMV